VESSKNRDGIGLDSAFKEIKQASADIFTSNETHQDELNAIARKALRLSKQRMWKDNSKDCKIVHPSLNAPVLNFTKPGGNLVGITGSLVGRIKETIIDPYGRWCGYTIIGKDTKEIMIIKAYNVSQYKNAKVGEDTLFNQQIALYKLKKVRDLDPKKIFIEDLAILVTKTRKEDKDIILTGDFNELVGDDPRGMSKVLSKEDLTDAHGHQKGMLEAEEQCRIYHRQPWTKEVNEVMTTANILRIHLSSMKNNIDCRKQISQKQTLLKKEISLPSDIKEA
jgi:hypothetical protein